MPTPTANGVAWFPVFTLALGYVGASIADWMKDRRTAARDNAARLEARIERQEARAERLETRRVEFVRPALIELQDATAKLARCTGAGHHADLMEHRKNNTPWGTKLLPKGLSDDFLVNQVRMATMLSRIGRGAVYDAGSLFKSACVSVSMAKSENESDRHLAMMNGALERLNEAITQAFHDLDGGR